MKDQNTRTGKQVSVTFRIEKEMDEKLGKLADGIKRAKSDVIRLILAGELGSFTTADKPCCGSCEFFCSNPEDGGKLDGECRKNPPTVTARASEFASVFADDWCGAYSPKAARAYP